jgi:hypothetical protein
MLKKPSIYRGDPGFHDISSRALLERVWVYQTYANMIFFSRKLKMLVSRCIEEVERTVKLKGLFTTQCKKVVSAHLSLDVLKR